jgi:hypothetical protein
MSKEPVKKEAAKRKLRRRWLGESTKKKTRRMHMEMKEENNTGAAAKFTRCKLAVL